jgi:hypothetical protein
MMEAVQVYPQMMEVAGDLVVKAQDWPGAEELSERLRKTIPPQLLSDKEKQELGNQPDIQGMMQQQAQQGEQLQAAMGELQKLQQENLVLKTKAEIEANKLKLDEFKAETERLLAYAEIAKYDEEIAIKRMEHQAHVELEAHKIETVRDKNDGDLELQHRTADIAEEAAEKSDAKPSTPASD